MDFHSLLPPTPEETTASMWADVNALSKEISMSETERSKQRVESFLNDLEQGTASLTDEEFTRLKHIILERRGRATARMIVAPIGTAQPFNPLSRYSEIPFDVNACMEGNTEGRIDPESEQLESPSAGSGFEAPGRQCLSNRDMEQTNTVDGCLLVDVS